MSRFEDFGIYVPAGHKGEYRSTCPRCSKDRKKSTEKCFSVNVEEGVWICNHCGWSGNLVCKEDSSCRVTPKPKPLFAKVNYDDTAREKSLYDWFQGRKIEADTVRDNKITLRKNSILFPYYFGGKVVNIKFRSIKEKRFSQVKGGMPCLYRHDSLVPGELVITEGEMDALAIYEAGYRNVTSIPNGAPPENAVNLDVKFAFLENSADLIERCDKLILAMDNDSPGEKAREELIRRLGIEKCYLVEYPEGCKDANDVLKKYGKDAVLSMIKAAKPAPMIGVDSPAQRDIRGLYENGVMRGLSTGWRSVDRLYTVARGEFTVITGIPNHGKSEWVEALMVNMILNHKWKFAIFSPENWPIEQHIIKICEKVAGMPAYAPGMESPRMDWDTLETAQEFLNDYLRFLVPPEDFTLDYILALAKNVLLRFGLDGLILDPWNEFEHRYRNMTEAQYLSEQLGKVKRFAKINNVHIWMVAHPKVMRTVKDEYDTYAPPTPYDISGGAHWHNKADNHITVYRENFNKHEAEIYVNKIRHKNIGRKGLVQLNYSYDSGQYFDKPVNDKTKFRY